MDEKRLAEIERLAEWTLDYHGMVEDGHVRDAMLELIAEVRRLREYEFMYKDLCE